MAAPSLDFDAIIYAEMLAHPVLFTHPQANHMALIGEKTHSIATEILKHAQVKQLQQVDTSTPLTGDARVTSHLGDRQSWLNNTAAESCDIIIVTGNTPDSLQPYYRLLKKDGVLVVECESLFAIERVKALYTHLQELGFDDLHTLHFPQPSQPLGSRAAILANCYGNFKRIREKDVFNKPFATRYYNFDIHNAALAMPQFLRESLALET